MARKELIEALLNIREAIIESPELTDYALEHAVYSVDDAITHIRENEER